MCIGPAPDFHAAGWTTAGFEGNEVFGIAFDDASPPNIYVTSTSSYPNTNGSGKIFKISGTTGALTPFGTALPNGTGGTLRTDGGSCEP